MHGGKRDPRSIAFATWPRWGAVCCSPLLAVSVSSERNARMPPALLPLPLFFSTNAHSFISFHSHKKDYAPPS